MNYKTIMDPGTIYRNRVDELKIRQKQLQKKRAVFGILRFGSIAAMIAAFYFLWSLGLFYVVSAAIILLVVFIRLVYVDLINKAAIKHLGHLITINESELKGLSGDYFHFADGAAYLPKDHLYAADIDVLGHASIYQYINRSTSDMGAALLADWLLQPALVKDILMRQEAVKELSSKMLWRQEIQATGSESNIKYHTFFRLQQWLHEPTLFLQFRHWSWLRIVLPVISSVIFTTAVTGWLALGYLYFSLLIFGVIAYQINKVVSPLHDKLSKMVDEIDTLSETVALIENENFQSPFLIDLQKKYRTKTNKASSDIRILKRILDRLDIRYNIVISAPLNLLFLWNLQQVLDLEKWKKQHAADVENWFNALAAIEALNSFAAFHFNNPECCFPAFKEEYFFIEASELGHPLININKRVSNYISIGAKGEIMLVTGSNMAGKSTYLRSVGINMILAMAGSAVCAATFTLSPVQLISSMRISDNLEENTSTFYAELKKLKTLIEKVNNGEKIFILLDEILRGTNSLDRHTGSAALMRQLIRHQSAGIIATHDLALADIKDEFPGCILNYHFDAQVDKEELYFDYKLKPGVSQSLNASLLIKKIGIEL